MRQYIDGFLSEKYQLSFEKNSKPDMSVTNLRCVLRHHWVADQEIYPTERQRIQMFLMLLLCAFTASQPGAIIDNTCANDTNRFLRYRDIEFMLMLNPEPGKRDLWVMKVTLVFLKRDHRKSNP